MTPRVLLNGHSPCSSSLPESESDSVETQIQNKGFLQQEKDDIGLSLMSQLSGNSFTDPGRAESVMTNTDVSLPPTPTTMSRYDSRMEDREDMDKQLDSQGELMLSTMQNTDENQDGGRSSTNDINMSKRSKSNAASGQISVIDSTRNSDEISPDLIGHLPSARISDVSPKQNSSLSSTRISNASPDIINHISSLNNSRASTSLGNNPSTRHSNASPDQRINSHEQIGSISSTRIDSISNSSHRSSQHNGVEERPSTQCETFRPTSITKFLTQNKINNLQDETEISDSQVENKKILNNSIYVQETQNHPHIESDSPDGKGENESETLNIKIADKEENLELQYEDKPHEIFEAHRPDIGDVNEEGKENAMGYYTNTSSITPTPATNIDSELMILNLSLDLTPTPVQGESWNDLSELSQLSQDELSLPATPSARISGASFSPNQYLFNSDFHDDDIEKYIYNDDDNISLDNIQQSDIQPQAPSPRKSVFSGGYPGLRMSTASTLDLPLGLEEDVDNQFDRQNNEEDDFQGIMYTNQGNTKSVIPFTSTDSIQQLQTKNKTDIIQANSSKTKSSTDLDKKTPKEEQKMAKKMKQRKPVLTYQPSIQEERLVTNMKPLQSLTLQTMTNLQVPEQGWLAKKVWFTISNILVLFLIIR